MAKAVAGSSCCHTLPSLRRHGDIGWTGSRGRARLGGEEGAQGRSWRRVPALCALLCLDWRPVTAARSCRVARMPGVGDIKSSKVHIHVALPRVFASSGGRWGSGESGIRIAPEFDSWGSHEAYNTLSLFPARMILLHRRGDDKRKAVEDRLLETCAYLPMSSVLFPRTQLPGHGSYTQDHQLARHGSHTQDHHAHNPSQADPREVASQDSVTRNMMQGLSRRQILVPFSCTARNNKIPFTHGS